MAAFASTREGALMFYKTATHEEPQEHFPEPQEWTLYEVYDPLGQKIGWAEDILANASDDPEYIRVRMGFLGPKTVLIPAPLAAADAAKGASSNSGRCVVWARLAGYFRRAIGP